MRSRRLFSSSTKRSEQVFSSKVPPGSLESVPILASALGARIPLFWEFGSSLNYALHRYWLLGGGVQTRVSSFKDFVM